MSQKTVMFISQSASPFGGVETWLEYLCKHLNRSGQWRAVVGIVRGVQVHDANAWCAAHPDLETIEIDGRGLNSEGRIRAVMRAVRKVRNDVLIPLIVIDAHDAACRLKLAGDPVRYLLAMHGNLPRQIGDAQRLAPFADAAVACGKLTERLAAWAGVPAERLAHIANAARVADVNPQFAKAAPESPLRLGYVGRMTREDKRVLDLVGVVDELVRREILFTLDVVGDGPDRAPLENELSERWPDGAITFHGAREADYLYREIYPKLDGLLLFSESEAFGIVLVEAMMHGVVPVVSDFLGRQSEQLAIEGDTALVFSVGDAAAAAGVIGTLAADRDLLQRLACRGYEHVVRRYSWERCLEDWQTALERCLEMPARRPDIDANQFLPGVVSAPSRMERFGVPGGVIDSVRRLRIRSFGVPGHLAGGEEWPFAGNRYTAVELQVFDKLRRTLDGASKVAVAPAALIDCRL